MFPTGRAGIALIFVRFALSIMLIHGVVAHAFDPGLSPLFLLTTIVAVALCLGFMTPLSSVLAVAVAVVRFFGVHGHWETVQICATLDAIALGLLGPGGYSMDAMLFGRRRIRLPRGQHPDDF
jgi:uncharacterized membrane protein YphA (DoxX/SURF4 family)